MALCLYHFGVYCDNLGTFYIFHKVLFKLPLRNLCWSFWINKSTSRIYRRKRRYKHILLSKRIGTWIDINHDKFEFYIMFLFGLSHSYWTQNVLRTVLIWQHPQLRFGNIPHLLHWKRELILSQESWQTKLRRSLPSSRKRGSSHWLMVDSQ